MSGAGEVTNLLPSAARRRFGYCNCTTPGQGAYHWAGPARSRKPQIAGRWGQRVGLLVP